MYRNDDKYHHGAFSGPNKHRLESLKNIIAVIGVIALIYFPYSIFVAPQFASPVVQTFPNQQQQQQQQQQGNDEPLDKRDLLKGLYNQDAVNQKQQEQKEQFSSSNNHHPDDVRLLKEMQTTIDRLTLERQADKEKQLTSGAALSEELRSAKDKYAKLNLINQEQQIDLDKVRARLETVSKELQTTKAQLERLRAMSPDADIQDYKPLPTVPWASKSWREQLGNVAWQFLHTVAARYPDKPTAQFKAAAHDLARSLQYLYPCDECRNHLNRNLRKVPGLWPPTVNSRESFSQWMCKLHNLINTQLDKPIFPCALRQLELRYMKNCDECVTNDPTMEKVDPIEDPVGYVDPVKQKSNNNNNNNKQNNVINKREELTPQQRRDRLLKLKQEQGDQWRPLEPERKYTGGQQSNNNNGEECTYKVSSWHQGTHQIVAGKVNLVVLFSPTCHVCKVYLPREVQQAYEKFKSRGLNLVAITDITPETESLLEQFVVDEKLTYPIGIAETDGPGTPYEKFVGKYKGVPAVLDIDATSCTVRKQLWGWRIESLDSYLEDRLPAKQ